MAGDLCPGLEAWHVQHARPSWDPLVRAVGTRLVEGFMWMHESELSDGTCLHAYKHVHTREYLYLTPALCAFEPVPCGRFAPLRLDFALERALCSWWILWGWGREDAEAVGTAIRRVSERAAIEA